MTYSQTMAQSIRLGRMFDIWLSFCHVTLKLAEMLVVKSRPSVP